jgi:isocitrate lyase
MTSRLGRNPPPPDLTRGVPEERWSGIARPYAPDDVERLRGTLRVRHTLAERGALRLWEALRAGPCVRAGLLTDAGLASRWPQAGLGALLVGKAPVEPTATARGAADLLRRASRAQADADRAEHAAGEVMRDWFVPLIVHVPAELDPARLFEEVRDVVEAGAAGVVVSDDKIPEGGATGGPAVIVSTASFIQRLVASRLAADVLGVPTVLIAVTTAPDASFLATDEDPRDREFLLGGSEASPGRHTLGNAFEAAVARARAAAAYADVVGFGRPDGDLAEAKRFAEGVRERFPGKPVAFGVASLARGACGPTDDTLRQLAALGYNLALAPPPEEGSAHPGGEAPRADVELLRRLTSRDVPS